MSLAKPRVPAPDLADIYQALAGCWCEDRSIVPQALVLPDDVYHFGSYHHEVVTFMAGNMYHCRHCHEDYRRAYNEDHKRVHGHCSCRQHYTSGDRSYCSPRKSRHTMSSYKDMRLLRAPSKKV